MAGGKTKHKLKHIKPYNPPTQHLTTTSTTKEPKSVQQRLEASRREASRPKTTIEAVQRVNGLNTLATTASLPLETRELLHLPESAPIQQRRRRGLRQNGPAGPAAPRSWGLGSSRFASAGEGGVVPFPPHGATAAVRWQRPERGAVEFDLGMSRIARLDDGRLASHRLPRRGSLRYLALKTLARGWVRLVREGVVWPGDLEFLETGLKSVLLTYLGRVGVEVRKDDLDVLFRESDSTDLKRLDFTGLVGKSLSLRDISRFLSHPKRARDYHESENIETEDILQHGEAIADKAFETWEEEANLNEAQLTTRTVGGSAFIHLTHLSLANPGPNVSWSDLLELAPKLNLLTHLSLANWKTPLLRRNTLVQAVSSVQQSNLMNLPSQANEHDRKDWDEPAHVLRALSRSTYSLEWLDLEGCNSWLPALAVGYNSLGSLADARPTSATNSVSSSSSEEDALWRHGMIVQAKGPDWNGSWRKLRYVNISQRWIPRKASSLDRMMPSLLRKEIRYYLQEQRRKQDILNAEEIDGEDEEGDEDQDSFAVRYAVWETQEIKDREVVRMIKALLDRHIKFDHGWEPLEKWKDR